MLLKSSFFFFDVTKFGKIDLVETKMSTQFIYEILSKFIVHQKQLFMHRLQAILFLALMQVSVIVTAQKNDTAAAAVNYQLKDNEASFNCSLRTLHQIPGAPEPFYSYFWEFGDGSFSFQPKPIHIFKDSGWYDVRLYATNNYDDGKAPPTRPKKIRVNSPQKRYLASNESYFFRKGGTIEMKVNRMPKPDEDMVLIVGYRNQNQPVPAGGSLLLFYNDKVFKQNSFDLSEARTYNDEKRTSLNSISFLSEESIETDPSRTSSGPNTSSLSETVFQQNYFSGTVAKLITSKQKLYRQNAAWSFQNLQQGEEKFFFITLHTTPEMLSDTNKLITLTGMFVPDNAEGQIEEYNLELQIVASHDPNRMMLKNQRLNYRFTSSNKEMQYTVRFQNTGQGAAKQIRVGVGIPAMLDPSSVEILDYYPKVKFCDSTATDATCLDTVVTKDSVYFIFKNVYLPGLREEGMNDPDSCVGYVKYRLHFKKQLKKLPFESNAAIVFDNNAPVYTNSPKGYFKPGNSPAFILARNQLLGNPVGKTFSDEHFWMIGASLSPYSPYQKYLQAEAFLGYLKGPEQFYGRVQNRDTTINNTLYFLVSKDTWVRDKIFKLNLVPVELRYNFMDYVGGGIGAQFSFDALVISSYRAEMFLVNQSTSQSTQMTSTYNKTQWLKNFDGALFADVQLGMVRVGPVGGIRFLHYFRFPQNRLMLYAAWRL